MNETPRTALRHTAQKKICPLQIFFVFVRRRGLEPPRPLQASPPQGEMSTNFNTGALLFPGIQRVKKFLTAASLQSYLLATCLSPSIKTFCKEYPKGSVRFCCPILP